MSGERQVGIVLVSHSGQVAESVAELARGLAAGGATAPVAAAGGTAAGGLGTSAELIAEAARSVDGGVGIAVLVDVGSAVLTVKAMLAEGTNSRKGHAWWMRRSSRARWPRWSPRRRAATWRRWWPPPGRRTPTERCRGTCGGHGGLAPGFWEPGTRPPCPHVCCGPGSSVRPPTRSPSRRW